MDVVLCRELRSAAERQQRMWDNVRRAAMRFRAHRDHKYWRDSARSEVMRAEREYAAAYGAPCYAVSFSGHWFRFYNRIERDRWVQQGPSRYGIDHVPQRPTSLMLWCGSLKWIYVP